MSCADHLPPVDLARISATSILSGEHQVILQTLAVLERLAGFANRSGAVLVDDARQALEILTTFADRCHHGKEESVLFVALERIAPGFGPVQVMRSEHDDGRALIAAMRRAVAEGQARPFAHAAEGYVHLLRQHIAKEDDILFRLADSMLSADDHAAIVEAYRQIEHDDIGDGTHERLLGMADALAERHGIPCASADPRVLTLLTAVCGCARAQAHHG